MNYFSHDTLHVFPIISYYIRYHLSRSKGTNSQHDTTGLQGQPQPLIFRSSTRALEILSCLSRRTKCYLPYHPPSLRGFVALNPFHTRKRLFMGIFLFTPLTDSQDSILSELTASHFNIYFFYNLCRISFQFQHVYSLCIYTVACGLQFFQIIL